ncbi:MAG: M28 family peptidase [Bacillota bacterium]
MKKIILIITLVAALTVMTGCAGGNDSGASEEAITNEASAAISVLTSSVNADNVSEYDFSDAAMTYLEYLGTKLENRSFDGSGENNVHKEAQDWIISELKNAGYTDEQITRESFDTEWDISGENIILTVEGEDPSKQIIVGGHYDGTGVGDNGSGTALILANAVGLQGVKPHYTVKYIFFDGEEYGCLGSGYNADQMTEDEVNSTIYMVNIDCLAFGDYCNIYGGFYGGDGMPTDVDQLKSPEATEAYDFAASTAESMGINVMRTADLDGYFAEHGTGPEVKDNTLYTNPWTPENPAPANNSAMSPSTLPASDHVYYMDRGIEYIYFEATNWYAECADDEAEGTSYTGYVETFDYSIGDHGMFMNTEYDTWDYLNEYFPDRAQKHFRIYSPLLSALVMAK